MVLLQVFLLLRVLLLRISAERMRSFWPVVLAEIYRVLQLCKEGKLVNPVLDQRGVGREGSTAEARHSDEGECPHRHIQVLYSVWQFLDLTLALRPEQFAYYEWMFAADTLTLQLLERALYRAQLIQVGMYASSNSHLNNSVSREGRSSNHTPAGGAELAPPLSLPAPLPTYPPGSESIGFLSPPSAGVPLADPMAFTPARLSPSSFSTARSSPPQQSPQDTVHDCSQQTELPSLLFTPYAEDWIAQLPLAAEKQLEQCTSTQIEDGEASEHTRPSLPPMETLGKEKIVSVLKVMTLLHYYYCIYGK